MIASEQVERNGAAVRMITLARPEQRNALTPGMLASLVGELNKAEAHGEAVLLRGQGRCFCAGFDLELCRTTPDGSTLRLLLTGLSDACRAMRRHPRPVVVVAHGAAIAGGCALLGGADLVIATAGCKLGYPVVRLGISPAVTVPLLRLYLGDGGARHRTLLPDLFDGVEGARRSLVHELHANDSEAQNAGLEHALGLAAKPPGAFEATKRWLGVLEGSDRDSAFDEALAVSLGLTGGSEEATLLGTKQPEPNQGGRGTGTQNRGDRMEDGPHG
ncbi:MAG: enoyl-CoA hydratase/isomerase family protein [Planctomycetota bacterium]